MMFFSTAMFLLYWKQVIRKKLVFFFYLHNNRAHTFQPLRSSKREAYSKPKIFDFKLPESLQNGLSMTFSSTKLSLESLILHYLRKSCHEYPREKIIGISIIVYPIAQQFYHSLKISNCIDCQTRYWNFFRLCQNSLCFS